MRKLQLSIIRRIRMCIRNICFSKHERAVPFDKNVSKLGEGFKKYGKIIIIPF